MSRPRAGWAAALALGLAACAGPSRSLEDYELKAANTAEATVSAVETARLGVRAAVRDRAFTPYLSVLLGEAEEDASAVQETFLSRQPPGDRADDLRDELDELLEQAVSVLADLRIAVRRGDVDELPELAEPLGELSDKLEAFEEAHG